MDPKASAKSKRTHSTHGRRNHPTPSAAAAARKSYAASGQPPRHPLPSALPSNWDRYESSDEEAEEAAAAARNPAGVAPKSKGADFGFLIEQARSQPPPEPESSPFPNFVTGFAKGASSILSVKGDNLLSWCEDDNFIVDDDPTTSFEVPFLSMDLHALAAQLSKLKLSQRLFIEADLLPEECDDQPQKSGVSEEQPETVEPTESLGSQQSSVRPTDHQSVKRVVDTPLETSTAQAAKLVPSNDSKPDGESGSSEVKDTILRNIILQPNQNETSRFGASRTAEPNIDMLLESFGQSSLSGSQMGIAVNNRSASQSATSSSSAPISFSSNVQDLGLLRNTDTTSLDDALDSLLGETSLCIGDQEPITQRRKKDVSSPGLLSSYSRVSGSMNASSNPSNSAMAASLDDSIDLLLAETSSFLGDKNPMAPSQKVPAVPPIAPANRPVAPKPVDDFDSWFDTL